jgi:hypothetical protein
MPAGNQEVGPVADLMALSKSDLAGKGTRQIVVFKNFADPRRHYTVVSQTAPRLLGW